MRSVRNLQPLLEERLQRLLTRFRAAKASGELVPLEYAFAAFAHGKQMELVYGFAEANRSRCRDRVRVW